MFDIRDVYVLIIYVTCMYIYDICDLRVYNAPYNEIHNCAYILRATHMCHI